MRNAFEIPAALVEQAWHEIGAMEDEDALEAMRGLSDRQPALFGFVLEFTADLSEEAHGLAVYMAVAIHRTFELMFPEGVPAAAPGAVARAYRRNVRWFENAANAHERVLAERVLPNAPIVQPNVMEYVVSCLSEPASAAPDLTEEDSGGVFLALKTYVEALDGVAGRGKRGRPARGRRSRGAPAPVCRLKVT